MCWRSSRSRPVTRSSRAARRRGRDGEPGDPHARATRSVTCCSASTTRFCTRALDAELFEPYAARASHFPRRAGRPGPPGDTRSTRATCASTTTRRGSVATAIPPAPTIARRSRPSRRYKNLTVVENAGDLVARAGVPARHDRASTARSGWQDYWRELRDNGVRVVRRLDPGVRDRLHGRRRHRRPARSSCRTRSSPPADVVFSEPTEDDAARRCRRDVVLPADRVRGGAHGRAQPGGRRSAFVDFLLSAAFQEDMPLQMFVYPGDRRAPPLPRGLREVGDDAGASATRWIPQAIGDEPRVVDQGVDDDRAAVTRPAPGAVALVARPARRSSRSSSPGRSRAIFGRRCGHAGALRRRLARRRARAVSCGSRCGRRSCRRC